MTVISRKLPRSSSSRMMALQTAKQKKDNTAAAQLALTPSTVTRLDAIVLNFGNARNLLASAEALSVLSTAQKVKLLNKLQLVNSHYIQVLNMHIEQEIFPSAYRAFFKIDTNSSAVPPNNSEDEIVLLAKNIIDGEPLMIAAGGTAIPFPVKATVKNALDAVVAKQAEQSTKKDATDKAEEAIEKLNAEADAVIKKVWDETETFYNEEPIESLRRKSREWGVVYLSTTDSTLIKGKLIDATTKAPIGGATISIVSTDEAATSQADGSFELKTGSTDNQILSIEKAGYAIKEMTINITAKVPVDVGTLEMINA